MNDDAIAAQLVTRMDRDQQARNREPPDWNEVAAVDADNTTWLASVLDRHGWPLRSQVGEQAATAAWLLAQHAGAQPEFQRRCLALLTESIAGREADPGNLAYLTDRVLCAEGRPQRYGTQFWTVPDDTDATGRLHARPIEDREHLDERRAAVGLGPFADYERHMIDGYGDA